MISADGLEATWTFSQAFTSSFQASCSELASRLKVANADSVHFIAGEIQALNKRLTEATGRLPSYDQRQNELQLKALEKSLEELRSSTAGKTKFAFKRKAKIPASASASSETATPPASAIAPAIPAAIISSTSRTISDHSNCYLSRSCLCGTSSSTDHVEVSIIRISSSILNLLTTKNESTLSANTISLSALHIRDIQNSILILGTVDGSIMLHNLTNCVVVAGCHQFRMHNSTAVDAYLDITSNPIIESCDQVRFGAYPTELKTTTEQQPLVTKKHTELPFLPQDFSHIRATPSPNWRVLEEDELVRDWPLSEKDYAVQLERALPHPQI
ncbi:tubulin binding cofactor C-domain-containing protein [Suillus clintonianus]|uniref:tubulin binding cofactor C-domain-containing protein n=1 Tax=Suillus clintonianus TaxID=1904413 RepID=UPI001B86DC63|nr:tubulin binding cofactor C-domain-containing protein [Suillus clintonianus]KAG2136047.1 tubulin binding cofactor C-domain-containing protein [Suillus clintonianus]